MVSVQSNSNTILEGNILTTLLKISLPIMLNQLLQTFYNISDSYFMGLLGSEALAASAFTSPIFQVLVSLGAGLATGGMIIFSKNIGAGKFEDNLKSKSQLLIVNLLLGSILTLVAYIFTEDILHFSGATGPLTELSSKYMKILFLSIPSLLIINSYSAIENSKGNTKKPLFLVAVSTGLNIILNSLAVKFNTGISGIALATLISSLLLTSYCIFELFKNNDISLKYLKPDPTLILYVLSMGIPVALSSSTASLGFVVMNRYVVDFGSEALAAFGIGNRINNIFYTPANGLLTGVSIMISQNLGAKNKKRMKEIFKVSMKTSISIAFLGSFLLYFLTEPMIAIFTQDPEIFRHSKNYLHIFVYCNLAWGVYQIYSGYFLGVGLTKLNFYINLGRVWAFRIPVLIFLKNFFSLEAYSIWFAMLISNILVMFLVAIIFYLKFNRHHNFLKKSLLTDA